METMVMVVHYSVMTDTEGELSMYGTAVAQLNYSTAIDMGGQHCCNADFGSPSIGRYINTCLAGLR